MHVDRFSTLDDLSMRERRDPDALLAFLREKQIGRVSTFEMTAGTWGALQALERRGDLTVSTGQYPWITLLLLPTGGTHE